MSDAGDTSSRAEWARRLPPGIELTREETPPGTPSPTISEFSSSASCSSSSPSATDSPSHMLLPLVLWYPMQASRRFGPTLSFMAKCVICADSAKHHYSYVCSMVTGRDGDVTDIYHLSWVWCFYDDVVDENVMEHSEVEALKYRVENGLITASGLSLDCLVFAKAYDIDTAISVRKCGCL